MPKAHPFGAALARLRGRLGFPTAYAFYHRREGRRNLGVSYRNYIYLEQGKTLPKAERVEAILRALGLGEHSAEARELVDAYFASLDLGRLERFRREPAPGALSPRGLGEEAVRQSLAQRTVQLELDQWRSVAHDAARYACHTYLVNTPGWTKVEELARLTGVSSGKLKRALAALAKAGVVELSDGRVRSPFCGKHLRMPLPLADVAGISRALQQYRRDWTEKRAKLAHLSWLTLRMDQKGLERYAHQLFEAVNLSAVYGDVQKTEDSAIYLVEGRVYGVFP